MKIELEEQEVGALLAFLGRATMQGAEVPSYTNLVRKIQQQAQAQSQAQATPAQKTEVKEVKK